MLGGELQALWDYDHDEEEWSDDYRLGDLEVTVSSFLVSTIDRFVDDVVLRTDTDPVKHMRLAALHRCRPLHGPELISAWQARAVYPDQLVAAVVERSLGPDVLRGWRAREALAGRGDDLAVHDLLARSDAFIPDAHRHAIGHAHSPDDHDVPTGPEAYVHRVGRTGRAESTGSALTLAAPEELRALRALEKAVGVQLQ